MKRTMQMILAASLLAVPAAARAQCWGCSDGSGLPAYALIDRPHPQANLFPYGGWTLYPGQAGSGVGTISPYSHVNGVLPPDAYARQVIETLQRLNIPRNPPRTRYLDRNPAVADNVKLPTPKDLLPKDPEKEPDPEPDLPPLPRLPKKGAKVPEKDKDVEKLVPPGVEKEG